MATCPWRSTVTPWPTQTTSVSSCPRPTAGRSQLSCPAQDQHIRHLLPQFHYKMDNVIVNQYVLRSSSTSSSSSSTIFRPSDAVLNRWTVLRVDTLTTCGKRPRILSCLHSVCEECCRSYTSPCPKYKFISCPHLPPRDRALHRLWASCAGHINTSILSRLPPAPARTVRGGSDVDRSCYQTVRQYCQSACTCQIANPLSSCGIM